jgi:hypothetical protein
MHGFPTERDGDVVKELSGGLKAIFLFLSLLIFLQSKSRKTEED